MFLLSALVAICPIVSAFIAPMAYDPRVMYNGAAVLPPVYSGYIAKPVVYGRQEIEGYNLNNRGQDYKNYIEDGLARTNYKDGAILVNNGAEGVSGARALYRGNKGDQGYISDSMASKYGQGGHAAAQGAQRYDYSGENGYGGYGNAGHHKGHKTSGFHKSYHNIEEGKDTKYVDEDHDMGEENLGRNYGSSYDDKAWDVQGRGRGDAEYASKVAEGAAGRHAMEAGDAQNAIYDSRHHNNFYHDKDLAQRNGAALAHMGAYKNYDARGLGASQMYNGRVW
ncbi:Hypothetical protein NTJ_00518 [Nesidiocoris tenuis]|uniref:Uncharacterized protein n=1 Tax=Nesidiocoris tenuis TaxID=355587 RepID=A0ABN7A713_9HEMI|nr:Hypothetical protein NTJ_00518 [Nesidiocoris tenuis]